MTDKKYLTWDKVAEIYNKAYGGRPAQTMEMDTVFDQVAKLPYIEETHDGYLIDNRKAKKQKQGR